jgi:hypothetical protein
LKPLYGKLAASSKKKEVVLGEAYGFKTRYNILIRLFRENIAPSVGNLDAIHGGLVNLLAYSHEVFVSGKEVEVDPINVMDFIYKEMYDTVITKRKTPVYAQYVMLLLLVQHTEHPLLTTHLTTHKVVKPQRKASPGVVKEVFASSDEEEEEDEEEEAVEVAPRTGPLIKNASNAFVPSSWVEIKANMKKLLWWERYVFCMNVDIDKKLHSQYVQNKHIQHDQRLIMEKLEIPKATSDSAAEGSSSTLSYKAWNSNSLVNWQDFEDVTGPSHGKASTDDEESEAEEEEEDGENFDEDEDSDVE